MALDPDVGKAFADTKSVNDALRSILEVAKRIGKKKTKRVSQKKTGRPAHSNFMNRGRG